MHRSLALSIIPALSVLLAPPALAFDLAGKKQIALETKDGHTIPIGSVTFTPKGDKTGFAIDIDTSKFKTFFLSMRDFKCLEGPELECNVPYPYQTPGTVTPGDLSWLSTSLLFFHKDINAYGAPMGNGLYYDLKMTANGLEGAPEAIDLNAIASPPADLAVPPYDADARTPAEDDSRWVRKLVITDMPKG